MLRSNGSICSITFLIRVRTLKTILKDFLILSFPFLGIFLAIIIIVQTVIALGLRLILNELQVGKYATAAQQSQQKDQGSRVQSGRLLFFRLRCFCRRFRCFSRTFTLQTGQAVLTAPASHFFVQLHTAGGSSLAFPSSISAIRSASSTWFRK